MGEVLLAEHRGLGSQVVVKLLHERWAADPAIEKRMQIEARALAGMRSPYLVEVRDFGQTPEGRTYFVMEYLAGRTLGQELKERGTIPIPEAISYCVEVLLGLEVAHANGIIHRDVKADNIFLCDATKETPRRAKVLDFGIAKVIEAGAGVKGMPKLQTEEGNVIGTPRVFSPEQALARPVDARTDVYATGLLLYTCLVGHGPFAHIKGPYDLLMAAATMPPDPPSAKAPQPVPPAIDDAILRALAKSPNDRFPSATAFAEVLRKLAASLVVDEQTDGETLHYAGLKAVTPSAVAPPPSTTGEVSVTAPLPLDEPGAQLSSAARIRSELEKETPHTPPPPPKPHMDDMTLPTPIRLQPSKEALPFSTGKDKAQEYPRAAVDDDQIRRLALAAPPEDTWLGAVKSMKNIPLVVLSVVLALLVTFIGIMLVRQPPPPAPIRVPAPARE
jgi:serine/threonine-protein kinase